MDDRPTLPGQGAASADPMAEIGSLVAGLQNEGGLDALVGKLRAAGLDGAVDSWVSTGTNQPVPPQQLGAALGPDTVNQLSAKTGLSVEMLLPLLAGFLPMIIDRLTPGGQVPQGGPTAHQGDIGDVLGGILGGGLGGVLGG